MTDYCPNCGAVNVSVGLNCVLIETRPTVRSHACGIGGPGASGVSPGDRVRVQTQTERRPMAPWITVDGTLVPASELEGAQRFRAERGTFLTVDLDTGTRVEVSQVLVSSLTSAQMQGAR